MTFSVPSLLGARAELVDNLAAGAAHDELFVAARAQAHRATRLARQQRRQEMMRPRGRAAGKAPAGVERQQAHIAVGPFERRRNGFLEQHRRLRRRPHHQLAGL